MQFAPRKGQPVQELLKQPQVPEDQALFPKEAPPVPASAPEPAYWCGIR